MSNLLITGGSGYIGSRLIYKLLEETNNNIVNYDISLFGDSHLPENKNFVYIKEDITNQLVRYHNVENQEVVSWFLA